MPTWTIHGRGKKNGNDNTGIDPADTQLTLSGTTPGSTITGANTGTWGTVTGVNSGTTATYVGNAGTRAFKILAHQDAVVCLIIETGNDTWWTAEPM